MPIDESAKAEPPASDYDWLWRTGKPAHEHPEYAMRSQLPAGRYADWLEGLERRHPGYKRSGDVVEQWSLVTGNAVVIDTMDKLWFFLIDKPDFTKKVAECLHQEWKSTQSEDRVKSLGEDIESISALVYMCVPITIKMLNEKGYALGSEE